MSLGLTKTKRRIASVKTTQKITKAMELVSKVKLKRYRDIVDQTLTYAEGLEKVMAELFLHDNDAKTHYALENEEAETTMYLVVTSSLGLCGGYNTNLYKFVDATVNPEIDWIVPLGDKGKAHFDHDRRFKHVDLAAPDLQSVLDPKIINNVCKSLKDAFNQRKVRKIAIIYTDYVNSISFVPKVKTLLPVQLDPPDRPEEDFCPPLFEPSAREQIHLLMPYYLASELIHKITISELCEQASRRNAMDTANDNADELLSKLTIEYNKARQAAITQEITEVVAGANNAN